MIIRLVGRASDSCRPKLHRWPFSFSTSCHSRLPCASSLPRASVRTEEACRLCLLETRVSRGLQCVRTCTQSVRNVLEGGAQAAPALLSSNLPILLWYSSHVQRASLFVLPEALCLAISYAKAPLPPKTSYKSRLRGWHVGDPQASHGDEAP
jgi:hypothetical protein